MRAHQNNELNKLAAIMKRFAGKSQGFAYGLLIGANVQPLAFAAPLVNARCTAIVGSARQQLQLSSGNTPI